MGPPLPAMIAAIDGFTLHLKIVRRFAISKHGSNHRRGRSPVSSFSIDDANLLTDLEIPVAIFSKLATPGSGLRRICCSRQRTTALQSALESGRRAPIERRLRR
ncbi:hypothetical protein L484_024487 [Morus notabilis]|uniref:Uncharacterized protein n=1 Tax=Morus notabilis TaxID=981085 RepID=W9RQN1_9ROSA|nr:hypothetical protein L484_024487 [Morus notabilis]